MPDKILSKIPLFTGLACSELDEFQSRMNSVHLKPGDILFHEGEPGAELFIVVHGSLEIFKQDDSGKEMVLTTVGAGEYIGEMSLITPTPRTASVRAKADTHLLVVSHLDYKDWLESHPERASVMLEVLSQRLHQSNNISFSGLLKKNRELESAYKDLKAAQEELVQKKKMEHELNLARDIQTSILPDSLPENEAFDFGGMSSPARQVGGDFYDVFDLGNDKVAIVIGDVADKGAPSAIFMARTHALITAIADENIPVEEVLQKVNTHILRFDKTSMFVTVIYGILDTKKRQLTYARAGHEPPFFRSAKNDIKQWQHNSGMVLGALLESPLDVQTIDLPLGSTLLLFTDGLTDCRNPAGELFGAGRIHEEFKKLNIMDAQQVCDSLFGSLTKFTQGAEQDDDVTLLAIRSK